MERLRLIKKHRHGRRTKQFEKVEQKMKEERAKRICERQKEFFGEFDVHRYQIYFCYLHIYFIIFFKVTSKLGSQNLLENRFFPLREICCFRNLEKCLTENKETKRLACLLHARF